MNTKYLEEIKARCEKATTGEWKVMCQGNTVPSLQVVTETTWEHPTQVNVCSSISPKREADADFITHSRTDIPALIAEVERLQKIVKMQKASCNLVKTVEAGKTSDENIALKKENAMLKKALELMAKYIVKFGRVDYFLCDNIPQSLHLKYQPKNDGNYENEPCIKCVQEYFQQQTQQLTHEMHGEKSDMRQTQDGKDDSHETD